MQLELAWTKSLHSGMEGEKGAVYSATTSCSTGPCTIRGPGQWQFRN